MALRFAVAMNKGGVGKTSFTLNEAWSLARILRAAKPDARVLIIDVDTQAGATQLLTGYRFTDKQPTVSTLLSGQHTFDEVLIRLEDSEFLEDDDTRAAFVGIDVIPACHEGTIRLGGPAGILGAAGHPGRSREVRSPHPRHRADGLRLR